MRDFCQYLLIQRENGLQIDKVAAYRNKHCWQAFEEYKQWWH